MPNPERTEAPAQPAKSSVAEELATIETQLEKVDEIENPIERTFKREGLLEQYDDLQAEENRRPSPNH